MPRSKIIPVILFILLLLPLVMWPILKARKPDFLNRHGAAYQTIHRAADALEDIRANPSTNDLAAYAASNASALKILREALNQEFELPESVYDPARMDSVDFLKSLALALKFEGREAELRGAQAEAVRSYLDLIRYGQKIENGILLFALIGVSIERMGVEALTAIEPKIELPLRAQIAAELRNLNSKRVPFAEIEDRERYAIRRNSPTPLHFFVIRRAVRPAIERGKGKYEHGWREIDTLASKFERRSVAHGSDGTREGNGPIAEE